MARNPKATNKKSQDRRPKSGLGGGRPRRGRPKVCIFCKERASWVDYKDVALLRRFINDRGRIKARGATGTCVQHQRDVAMAVKTAREVALLPYVVRTVATEPRRGRGEDRHGNGAAPPEGDKPASDVPAPSSLDAEEKEGTLEAS
jgi:small subunit ribosomal protein S18